MSSVLAFLASEQGLALTGQLLSWGFTLAGSVHLIRKAKVKKVMTILEASTLEVYECYVMELKKAAEDGKLTPEERQLARDRAVEVAIRLGAEQGVDIEGMFKHKESLYVLLDKIIKERKK
jgi:hypothetical protein